MMHFIFIKKARCQGFSKYFFANSEDLKEAMKSLQNEGLQDEYFKRKIQAFNLKPCEYKIQESGIGEDADFLNPTPQPLRAADNVERCDLRNLHALHYHIQKLTPNKAVEK